VLVEDIALNHYELVTWAALFDWSGPKIPGSQHFNASLQKVVSGAKPHLTT
jgi:hypothetical protein